MPPWAAGAQSLPPSRATRWSEKRSDLIEALPKAAATAFRSSMKAKVIKIRAATDFETGTLRKSRAIPT
jgi:hypothetical protein